MEYFAVLTLTKPPHEQFTAARTLTLGPDATMERVFEHMRAEVARQVAGFDKGAVLFFGAWPSQFA